MDAEEAEFAPQNMLDNMVRIEGLALVSSLTGHDRIISRRSVGFWRASEQFNGTARDRDAADAFPGARRRARVYEYSGTEPRIPPTQS